MQHELIGRVREIFAHIDSETAAFRLATGLRCPRGCGCCCASRAVYTTVLEMLPAAAEILRREEAPHWLAAIESSQGGPVCAAYRPTLPKTSAGHCRLYFWRPTICRLFGFAAARNRYGRPELAACRVMKKAVPDTIERAEQAISRGLAVPILSACSVPLAALEPALGAPLVPINQALQQAIQRLGLRGSFDPGCDAGKPGHRRAA